jgi:uncharacterized membrane protein YfcA
LDGTEVAILAAVALASAVLSAVVGMAGGITLLSVMLLFLEPLVAIPLHGVIQLFSNSSRTFIQRNYVEWGIMWRYGALLIPMGFVGLWVAQSLPPSGLRALIGAFVLAATWAPGLLLLGTHPERTDPNRRFVALGGVAGVLNITVGATGPLIAPFFLDLGIPRQGVIGTKAACQSLGHLVKIGLFGAVGFAYREYLLDLAVLCAMVIVGTWIGSRLLERVNEIWFRRLYKGVLTLIALRLLLGEGLSAFERL